MNKNYINIKQDAKLDTYWVKNDIFYKNMNKNNVIIKKIINDASQRTVRIAKARNECLNIVYNELKDISFHIMIDSHDKGAV